MEKNSSGLGVGTVLTIVFVILKLVGVINWSWVWVLCPVWIPAILIAAIFLFFFISRRR